jgi:hypothetical protein
MTKWLVPLYSSPPCRLSTSSRNEQVLTAALRNSLSSSPDIQMTMSFSRELSLAPHSTEIAPSDPFRLPVHGVETFQAVAEPMTKPDRPGSPLRIPTTAGVPKEPTLSMQTYRGTTVLQSSDIVINSFPSAPPPAKNHFMATQPRTSYGPIPDHGSARRASLDPNDPLECVLLTSLSDVPATRCKGAKRQPAERTLPPLPRLLPRSLNPICEKTQDSDDSLRVSRGPRKCRISNYYHVHPRPLDIPKLHHGLPDNFGEFIRLPIVTDFAEIILMLSQFLIQRRSLRKGQVETWSPMTLHPSYLSTARLAVPWRRGNEFWRSSDRV